MVFRFSKQSNLLKKSIKKVFFEIDVTSLETKKKIIRLF